MYMGEEMDIGRREQALNGHRGGGVQDFVSGGELRLRRNHEAETHFQGWPLRGETWRMNPDDVPHVASAMDAAFKRRLRCVAMRSKFAQDPSKVCAETRTYLADDSLKDWMRGGGGDFCFLGYCGDAFYPEEYKRRLRGARKEPARADCCRH